MGSAPRHASPGANQLKAAILTNRAESFYRPLAEGLDRMFREIGLESVLLYDGLESLRRRHRAHGGNGSNWKGRLFQIAHKGAAWMAYQQLLRTLRNVDFVVIVDHMPLAYVDSRFDDRRLRDDLPKLPIILYDLVYLGSRANEVKWLLECQASHSVPKGKHWGPNRYDHHLCITEISETPVIPGAESFSRIGINLVDPLLRIEPRELCALIDFERPNHLAERAVQVQACLEAGIPFKVLHGRYSIEEIRKIYRSCSLYFLAHCESFGLPICEVQACGALILTPYAKWCHAHYLETPQQGHVGRLPHNFIVYNNDKDQLVAELERLKTEYKAESAQLRFKREQPHFHRGDTEELARFVALVKEGRVHSRSHRWHPTLEQLAQAAGPVKSMQAPVP